MVVNFVIVNKIEKVNSISLILTPFIMHVCRGNLIILLNASTNKKDLKNT